MQETHKTFKYFQALASSQPSLLGSEFENKVNALANQERRTLFADTLNADQITDQLKAITEATPRLLDGVPYLLQDMFDVAGQSTRCGAPLSEALDEPVDESCLLYTHLNALGACYLGKTQTSEFGMEPSGANLTHGKCTHPNGPDLITGGGASAASVAVKTGYAPLAFGLDTYGGVRIPAAFLGLFAYRMESNRFAESGVFPIAPSIESVGFFTNNLEDLKTTFLALYGYTDFQDENPVTGCFVSDISGAVNVEIKSGLVKLCRVLGAHEDLSVSTKLTNSFRNAKTTLDIILSRELYSIHRYWIEEYEDQYDPHLVQFIDNGMNCSPSATESANETQRSIRAAIAEVFIDYDYIILPISTEANLLTEDWSQEIEDDIIHLIAPVSLAFIPAIILPINCGEDRTSAVQVLINPEKLNLVPSIIAKAARYYANGIRDD
jgi:aspartyl-tRNA(Asn)/glutamyl-tRNA(Gln) amidotransferase subunit A